MLNVKHLKYTKPGLFCFTKIMTNPSKLMNVELMQFWQSIVGLLQQK